MMGAIVARNYVTIFGKYVLANPTFIITLWSFQSFFVIGLLPPSSLIRTLHFASSAPKNLPCLSFL